MKEISRALVLDKCRELLQARIASIKQAMAAAQEAANAEDKSSAGDKYETARAMGQLDRDMNARQLEAALTEWRHLEKISYEAPTQIGIGSLIYTDKGHYFISIGLGKLIIDKQEILVISPLSPIAGVFTGKKKGDQVSFRDQKMKINFIG